MENLPKLYVCNVHKHNIEPAENERETDLWTTLPPPSSDRNLCCYCVHYCLYVQYIHVTV